MFTILHLDAGKERIMAKLKDIVTGKQYPYIECRCIYEENNETKDESFGACAYMDGKLVSLDGDFYSLEDIYEKWNEFTMDTSLTAGGVVYPAGTLFLAVWMEFEVLDNEKPSELKEESV